MKPDVKKLVDLFADTATRVKLELKAKGFVLPVAHNGGIKFKHLWLKRNDYGLYDIRNLHNPKIVYHKDVGAHKLAMAIVIYDGFGVKFNLTEIQKLDNLYLHHANNITIYNYHISAAQKRGDDVKEGIIRSRVDQHEYALNSIRKSINHVLDTAEKLLFENK